MKDEIAAARTIAAPMPPYLLWRAAKFGKIALIGSVMVYHVLGSKSTKAAQGQSDHARLLWG